MKPTRAITSAAAAASLLFLNACGVMDIKHEQAEMGTQANAALASTPPARATFMMHDGAWLLGEKIPASKPQPAIYDKVVLFNGDAGYTLTDVANWISDNVHVRAVVDPSALGDAASPATAAPFTLLRGNGSGPLPAGLATPLSGPAPAQPALKFKGKFRQLLDRWNTSFGVWSRYQDGQVTFFKKETRTFPIPSLPDFQSMSGTISTGDNSASGQSSSGSSASSSSSSGGDGGSSSGSGGQTMKMTVTLNPWEKLEADAKAIAGQEAVVTADPNLQIMTVTGSPPACDRVESFVRDLNAMYGKQVAIDIHVYKIQIAEEHNYGANLALAYTSGGGHTGVNITGAQAPSLISSATPMTFGASILGGSLAGSSATVQALSTLGNVSDVVSDAGITQNGKKLSLQAAEEKDYVTGNQSTLVASVGSSNSIQTTTLVSGFTGSFIPKIQDGRVLVAFDVTLTDKPTFTTFPPAGSSSTTSSVQLKDRPISRLQQSVSLKPGESLVLTGLRQRTAQTTNNGVGSPYMPLLGGGVDAQKGDTILAIVISARLL